jgi:hypothetical protein
MFVNNEIAMRCYTAYFLEHHQNAVRTREKHLAVFQENEKAPDCSRKSSYRCFLILVGVDGLIAL